MDNDTWNSLSAYLAVDDIVDWQHQTILELAARLAHGAGDKIELAQRCFLFVRDSIAHSFDIEAETVTCSASEVLKAGHGICYAKSHLLAALLRANGIPSGFSYQRLSDDVLGYCLHGFNSLYLPDFGWYRVDARGNKHGVDAWFRPPEEKLAFSTEARGECDYGLNLAIPLEAVVRALRRSENTRQLSQYLPEKVNMG